MGKKKLGLIVGLCVVTIYGLSVSIAVATELVAEPESINIDLNKTAVVVIDMQNAFVSKGGMFDLRGFDVTPNQKIIEPIKKICNAARQKNIKIIKVAHVLSPDLRDVGPDSSFWYKSVKHYRENPKWKNAYLIRDTWGSEYPDELKPTENDIYIEKPRFSAFFGTRLDVILKTYGLKHLIFVGIATNICVEASIKDAGHLGYWPILITDATTNAGPPFTQNATIFNVKLVYGWVTNTENILKALK